MKKILILTTRPLHNGPRIIREIEALKGDFEIVATGTTPPHLKEVEFIHSDKFIFTHLEYTIGKIYRVFTFNRTYLGKYATTQWKINNLLKQVKPDIVIVHEPAYLPYVFFSNQQFKVVFNAHEYHPLEVEGDMKWTRTWGKIYDTVYRKFLPKLDLLINVNQEIADQCENEYQVKSLIIPNASKYFSSNPKTIKSDFPLLFVHHGVPNPDRKLEVMMEAFRILGGNYKLDLMLVQNGTAYYQYLERLAQGIPNVKLIPPVDYGQIIPFISQYDLGIYSLAPISFNNQMALPNKFFEFVQARLPMVIGPSPVMSKYVEKYGLGKVAPDFSAEALAKTIQLLTFQDLERYRSNLERAASDLSMEQFDKNLLTTIKNLD